MKIAIIQFPGSNCQRESAMAVKRAGMEPVEFLWNEPEDKLFECDGYFIIGGFSYEDRSRAGIIASLDPVMKTIRNEADKGKPVLGICNGAQILVETGLIPGLPGHQVGMALASNHRVQDGHVVGTGYYNVWVNVLLTTLPRRCAFTRHLRVGQTLNFPIAHAEGRFMMDEDLLTLLQENNQSVFKYCDHSGTVHPEFPINPNGSMDNLAAVCNTSGNVLAMMPHPERSPDGDPIFSSLREYLEVETKLTITSLDYQLSRLHLETYQCPPDCQEFLVDLIITDNEAKSVENAMQQLNVPVTVSRQSHWEIALNPEADKHVIDEIIASGELFNSNKEVLTEKTVNNNIALLVRYKDDLIGQHKKETLQEWFHIKEIKKIRRGVVWHITPNEGSPDDVLERVLQSHILFNPFSHECYRYERHE